MEATVAVIEPTYDSALDSSPYVELGDKHLKFRDDTPYEVWAAAVKRLKSAEKAIQWWLGDALRFGERKYGEMYSQALEESDYSYGALRDVAWVAGRFELSRRRDNLPWSHHREVAALEPEEQEALLDQAVPPPGETKPRMSSKELREHAREIRMLPQDKATLPKKDMSPGRKWSSAMYDIQVRLNGIRDLGGIEAMTRSWTAEDKEVLGERLGTMSQTLGEFSKVLKGGEK